MENNQANQAIEKVQENSEEEVIVEDEPMEKEHSDKIEDVVGEDLDDTPIVEGGIDIDFSKYEGIRLPIKVVKKIWAINYYTGPMDENGRPTFNKDSEEKMQKVYIETAPLPALDENGQPTSELLTIGTGDKKRNWPITRRFNLTYKQVNGEYKWTVSKAPQAKLWKFMRKCGAKVLSELKGKLVTITTVPDKDENSEKVWPTLVD